MIDSNSLDDVLVVRRLRELVRHWWRLEVAFADVRGYVADHALGVVIPPDNAYCRAALKHSDGFRRCNRSVADATDTLKAELAAPNADGASRRGRVVGDCHLGFPVVMAPVTHMGELYGTLFTGGFVLEPVAESMRRRVARSSDDLRLPIGPDRAAALRSIPVLGEGAVEYLCDIMGLMATELVTLVGERSDPHGFDDLLGNSPSMRRLYGMLERISQSDATVLVMGENGTGKEVVARAIHAMGPRRSHAFVATNCSALNDNLLESELFGHTKGAFTGAIRDKDGLFKAADTGTLFLDEVGDTSPAMQVKLLRVLQEGTFTPVGATEPVEVDVRVIAATNRPLGKMVKDTTFREDLYYRLSVLTVELPPLRERKTDIAMLCDHFLKKMAKKSGVERRLAPDVLRRFWEYDWPGNVRQLENEIERLVVLTPGTGDIGPAMLSPPILSSSRDLTGEIHDDGKGGTLDQAIARLERRLIQHALVRTNWNKSAVARELGLSRTTLIKKIRELAIDGHDTEAAS